MYIFRIERGAGAHTGEGECAVACGKAVAWRGLHKVVLHIPVADIYHLPNIERELRSWPSRCAPFNDSTPVDAPHRIVESSVPPTPTPTPTRAFLFFVKYKV